MVKTRESSSGNTSILKLKSCSFCFQDIDSPILGYNLWKVSNFDSSCYDVSKALPFLQIPQQSNFSHGRYEVLLMQQAEMSHNSDPGLKLQWMRSMKECVASGNLDAAFDLCKCYILDQANENNLDELYRFSRYIFQKCNPTRVDRLETQHQPKINALMHCILVDWLAEVAYMKDMPNNVLQAAVNFIDQYLVCRIVERAKLQLLGITCLLISAK